MHSPRTRRVERIHLAKPLLARLGAMQVALVDVSVLGARIEHHMPLTAGAHSQLSFSWDDERIETDCRIVRSRLERLSVGADGLTVYHSGLEFENMAAATTQRLKVLISRFITRALEEQKLNARGVAPQHDVDKMPIFRYGGQLTANRKDGQGVGAAVLPVARVVSESGYICYHLEHNQWRRKRTHDPGQPVDGFTISAMEDVSQAELLCDAYLRSDGDGRRMIQLCAQLSVIDDEGPLQGRFEP